MNDQIVENMIEYIEEKERQLQREKLGDSQIKSNIVKMILDELEREVNED